MTDPPPEPTAETVYRGRPQGLEAPVGQRAPRPVSLALAATFVAVGVIALVLRWTGA